LSRSGYEKSAYSGMDRHGLPVDFPLRAAFCAGSVLGLPVVLSVSLGGDLDGHNSVKISPSEG